MLLAIGEAIAVQQIGLLPLGQPFQAIVQFPARFLLFHNTLRLHGIRVGYGFDAPQLFLSRQNIVQRNALVADTVLILRHHPLLKSSKGIPHHVHHGVADGRSRIGQELHAARCIELWHGLPQAHVPCLFQIVRVKVQAGLCQIHAAEKVICHLAVFNQIFTKEELEELLENEVFHKMTGSKENPLNRPELLESENWFCIHGKFISKNMTMIGRAWVAASLNNRDITPVKIFYMTGEFLEVKTGHSWNISTIQSFNYLLWNEYKIIPVKVFSKDYERITTILKSTYSKIKEEKNLCEKEMIRYLLESGAEVKALFWNEIPGFKPLNKYEDEGKK